MVLTLRKNLVRQDKNAKQLESVNKGTTVIC